MKKLVTIRKAPDGKGQYLNKTAKFLNKAQGGGQQEGGYNQKILEYVAQEILQREQDPQTVYQNLLESKIDEDTALKHVQAIMQYQQQQMTEQQQGAPQEQAAEQDTAYTQAADEVEQDLAGQYGYYNPSGVGQELAADESEDQINQEADEDVYNMVMGDDQGEYQDGGTIDDYIVNRSIPNYLGFEGDDLNAFNYANGGATNKRSFIKNVMSELKKAREGIQQEDPSEQFDRTDTLTLDRGKKNSKFVEGLARTTQTAKDKQKAEEAWQQQQQMMQQGPPMEQPGAPMQMPMGQDGGQQSLTDNEHPYHHLAMMQNANNYMTDDPMNTTFMGQKGMSMPSPREYRKMHRTVNRALPNMYLDPNIKHTSMNVTDTDWLGRPKQYTMDFQGQQGISPGWGHGTLLLGLPGGANMGVGGNSWSTSWGSNWNTVKGMVETTRVKREGIIRDINKKADPQTYDKDNNNIPDLVQRPDENASPNPPSWDQDNNQVADVSEIDQIIYPGQPDSTVQPKVDTTKVVDKDKNGMPDYIQAPTNQIMGDGLNFDDPSSKNKIIQNGLDDMIKQHPPTMGQDHDDWMASWNGSVGFAPNHTKWDGTQWKQMGGFADPESGLTRFVYGGDDDMFDDYRNSINTADPYFGNMYRNGGMPTFEGGGQWVTKPDGTTIFLKDDGTVDKTKTAMSDDEKKLYEENTLKRNKEYYDKNKDKFTNPADQQKLIDDAINKRMEQYTRQYGNNTQQQNNGYGNYGRGYNPGYRSNGFLDQVFSANLAPNYLGTWSKLKGMETSDGMPFTGFDNKTNLTNLKVTKSGWLSGRPKEYEMSFSKYIDPRTANDITLDPKKNALIQSQDKNKNQVVLDPNGKPGSLERGWGPDELLTGQDRRRARRHDRFIDDIRNSKGVDEVVDDRKLENVDLSDKMVGPVNDAVESDFQPNQSAMDYMRQSLNTGSNNVPKTALEKQIQENASQTNNILSQKKSFDPKATGSSSGISSVYEPEKTTANSYVAPPKYNTLYPAGTTNSGSGIDSFIPNNNSMMSNPDGFAYGGYMPDYMAYGGYLPQAVDGNNPVDYTMNPAYVGKSNLDLISTYDNMGPDTGLQPSSMWGDMNSFDAQNMQGQQLNNEYLKDCTDADKQDPTSKCYEGIKLNTKNPMSINPADLKKEMMDKQDIKAKFKNKDITQWDTGALLAAGNKLGSTVPWLSNQFEMGNLKNQKLLSKPSDNVYASNVAGDPYKKTGQTSVTGSSTGLDFARDQGQIQYGQTQKGGALQVGGTAYMTADEVKRFMEQGGQIEFI